MPFARGDVRDHIVSHESDQGASFRPLSIAVAEPAKNQLLRDFRHRSIFDFCNTIDPDCVKTRMLRFAGAAGWLMKSSLCTDRFY